MTVLILLSIAPEVHADNQLVVPVSVRKMVESEEPGVRGVLVGVPQSLPIALRTAPHGSALVKTNVFESSVRNLYIVFVVDEWTFWSFDSGVCANTIPVFLRPAPQIRNKNFTCHD